MAAKKKRVKKRASSTKRRPASVRTRRHRRDLTSRKRKTIHAQSIAAKGSARRLKFIVDSMSFTFDARKNASAFVRAARKICAPDPVEVWGKKFGATVQASTLKAPSTCLDVAKLATKHHAIAAQDYIFDRTKKLVSLTARKRRP